MPATKWKPEWDALLRERAAAGASNLSIAAEMRIGPGVVAYHRSLLGIAPAPHLKWRPEWDALPSVLDPSVTHCAVASELGVSTATVQTRRAGLGVRMPTGGAKWKREWDALVGTIADAALAVQIGVDAQTVAVHRRKLSIHPFGISKDKHRWRPEWTALIGTKPDAALAQELGVSAAAVAARRRALGIQPNGRVVSHDRDECRRLIETEGYEAALARFPRHIAAPIARMLGKLPSSLVVQTWNPDWDVLLGTKPDDDLAVDLNVPRPTVTRRRTKLGIRTLSVRDVARAALAAMTDAEIARPYREIRIGRRRAIRPLVDDERRRRGIIPAAPAVAGRDPISPDMLRRAALAGMLAVGADVAEAAGVLRIPLERAREIAAEAGSTIVASAGAVIMVPAKPTTAEPEPSSGAAASGQVP